MFQADFILVIVSPQYHKDTSSVNNDSGVESGPWQHSLHTRYLCKLMWIEYAHNNCRNMRFIPIMFKDATIHHVPMFLQNTLVYSEWRKESIWNNLCFRLCKPDRLMQQFIRELPRSPRNGSPSTAFATSGPVSPTHNSHTSNSYPQNGHSPPNQSRETARSRQNTPVYVTTRCSPR